MGGRGGDRGAPESGAPEHDLQPRAETWHADEHIRSEFSALVCQGLNRDLLNLFPGPPEGLQLLRTPHPWMVRGGSEGSCGRDWGGDGVLEEGEHVDVRGDAGGEREGGRLGCRRKKRKKMKGQELWRMRGGRRVRSPGDPLQQR